GRASEVDHDVGPLDDRSVEPAGVGVPGRLTLTGRPAHQAGDLVAGGREVPDQRLSEEAAGAGDHDVHSQTSKAPASRRFLTSCRKRAASAPSMMRWS